MQFSTEEFPSDALLKRCAESWGLTNITFVRKMENIVFSCDSAEGKVYLRLTTPLRRVRTEIESEIHWMAHLTKYGLKIPRLIQDQAGNKICSFSEGEQRYEGVVFSALEGQHPSLETATDPQFLRTLGGLIAKMHLASQDYQRTGQIVKREEWFEDRGLRHASAVAEHSQDIFLREKLGKSIAWMQSLQRTSENYGLVHADLGRMNLFVEEDRSIGIIDFDDSCYHWFAFDLAIVIFSIIAGFEHTASQPEETGWLNDLLEGYRSVRPFNLEHVPSIHCFIDFACLRLFFWIEYHEQLKTFHPTAEARVAQLKQWVRGRICSND